MPAAWDLIGFDGQVDGASANVRVVGGRTLYEAVDFNDSTPGDRVRLARLEVCPGPRLRQINRYVDADTQLEVVLAEPHGPAVCPNGHAMDEGLFECPACGAYRPSMAGVAVS